MDDLYQEIILEEYQHPKNQGVFNFENRAVKSVKKTNVGCGDEFTVSLLLDEVSQQIKDVRWQGTGCAISTAGMSLLSEYIKGKTMSEVLQIEKKDMLEMIGVNEITIAREKCLLLSLKAVKGALHVDH